MAFETRQQFFDRVHRATRNHRDYEPYIHIRDSAMLHVQEGMREGLSMELLRPRCEHLSSVIAPGVTGCYQVDLQNAYLNDWLTEPPEHFIPHEDDRTNETQIVPGAMINRIFSYSYQVSNGIGRSISFGREAEISAWLVSIRKINNNLFQSTLNTFRDSLIGATLTWVTGSSIISSNEEIPRSMNSLTEPYKVSFDDVLKINDVIVSDSNRSQILCNIDTTSSYRIKTAYAKATTGASTDFTPKKGGDITTQFTGEGNIYTLTYGVYVDAQNAILTREADEREARSFDGLCVEFEKIPSTTE